MVLKDDIPLTTTSSSWLILLLVVVIIPEQTTASVASTTEQSATSCRCCVLLVLCLAKEAAPTSCAEAGCAGRCPSEERLGLVLLVVGAWIDVQSFTASEIPQIYIPKPPKPVLGCCCVLLLAPNKPPPVAGCAG